MEIKLIENLASDLLQKFGRGKATPGSGSAAAFQGMLSAQLIITVIKLTNKAKYKPTYDEYLPELNKMQLEIENAIYPALEDLFQRDSDEFDKYILLLKEREVETDVTRKALRETRILDQLRVVTESALSIGKLNVKVANASAYIFDNAFKDVRGDSAVALNGAVGAVAGCLAIIELNLLSFELDVWVQQIRSEIKTLKVTYNGLLNESLRCLHDLEEENNKRYQHLEEFHKLVRDFQSGRYEEVNLSERGIERLARDMQNFLWTYRDLIWKDERIGNFIDVLDPAIALSKILGYDFQYASLENYISEDGDEVQPAGLINKENRIVRVSDYMHASVRNFTTAHELGHAILHKGMVLHRDRALDGTSANKDQKEWQADKFATYFLMPAKQVKAIFEELFLMEKFVINERTLLAFAPKDAAELKKRVKLGDRRAVATQLAETEYFHARAFRSIADIFNVSAAAMAIRLEELELIGFLN